LAQSVSWMVCEFVLVYVIYAYVNTVSVVIWVSSVFCLVFFWFDYVKRLSVLQQLSDLLEIRWVFTMTCNLSLSALLAAAAVSGMLTCISTN